MQLRCRPTRQSRRERYISKGEEEQKRLERMAGKAGGKIKELDKLKNELEETGKKVKVRKTMEMWNIGLCR